MLLYIIRHGETEWNASGFLQGQSDTALNAKGIRLARETGEGMTNIHFDLAISSPLSRAVDTARLVLGNRDIPILTDDRLKEISFGGWEGKIYRGAHAEIPADCFLKFYQDPLHFENDPSGESIPMLIERLHSFFLELRGREEWQDKTILIATHGCALRALLWSFIKHEADQEPDYWMGGVPLNCAVTIAELTASDSAIRELDHLYYDASGMVNYFTPDAK